MLLYTSVKLRVLDSVLIRGKGARVIEAVVFEEEKVE